MSIIDEIASERRRQIEQENWTLAHDSQHVGGEIAWAAACYAAPREIYALSTKNVDGYAFADPWPWALRHDKRGVHDRRRQLVIAAALIVAEIERLDRKEATDG